MSGSSRLWYEKFLSSLNVPATWTRNISQESVFYAIRIPSIEFMDLQHGFYELHFFFYDTLKGHFFGRQFNCRTSVHKNSLEVDPAVIFFHTTITENRISIICELVKLDRTPWVYAWTSIPLVLKNRPLTDFNSAYTDGISASRHQLYCGSCLCLEYVSGEMHAFGTRLAKVNGVLLAGIQTCARFSSAATFVPEHFFISTADIVPGIVLNNDGVYLSDTFMALIDNAALSWHNNNGESVERDILDMLLHDYCLRLNRPIRDYIDAGQLNIIERRLKIGVHNSLCYVEEPHYLYLYDWDEIHGIDRGTLRRRSRSVGRSVDGIICNSSEFIARNCVRLNRLCADTHYAIVFSVDLLVGFVAIDGTIRESRWVMLAWNAWSPFHDGAFAIADTITIPLVGGPRPNPDDVLCFKSLINISKQTQRQELSLKLFPNSKPTSSYFNLRFNFAVVDATNSSLLMLPNSLHVDTLTRLGTRKTPSPNPDLPFLIVPEFSRRQEHTKDSPSGAEAYQRPDKLEEQDYIEMVEREKSPSTSLAHFQGLQQYEQSNIEVDRDGETTTRTLKRTQSVPVMETMKKTYSVPQHLEDFSETRVSAFPRNAAHHFTLFSFAPIVRDVPPPQMTYVEPGAIRPLSLEAEHHPTLATNEVVLQFMGIHSLTNRYYDTGQHCNRYFFAFQFYRFSEIITERLLAQPNSEGSSIVPMVLRRIDENDSPIKEDGYGFMVRFIIRKASIPANDSEDFAQYLLYNRLYVNVWNADSLLYVGTCTIPLQLLCRQNANAVVSDVQAAVMIAGLATESPITTALLYLRLANIGRDSSEFKVGENGMFSRFCNQHNSERFCRRARPLNAVHDSALQRFLSTQKLDLLQRQQELFSNDAMRRIERWNVLKESSHALLKAPLKKFIFREELEAYKTLRSESKASALLRAVFRGITTRYTVHAKYGQVEFFEFLLQNTFVEQIICSIDINDTRLSLILNSDEWQFYKSTFRLQTPIERDLFSVENTIDGRKRTVILLDAMESVCVPFKFDSQLGANSTDSFGNGLFISSEIRVIFKRVDTEEPVSILEVLTQTRNVAISREFRIFAEENRKLTRIVKIHGIPGNRQVAMCRASSPLVLCTLRRAAIGALQEIHISCNAPHAPNVYAFYVFLYADRFFARQLAVWRVVVHATRRIDVHAIQSQLTKIPLSIGGTNPITDLFGASLQLFSTSLAVTFHPAGTFCADAHILNDLYAFLIANFTGQHDIVLNSVDVQSRRLVQSWLLRATVGEPNIVRIYEIRILAGHENHVSKKIDLVNDYGIAKRWRVHTSDARLVSTIHEYYTLAPNSSTSIQLNFHPLKIPQHGEHKEQVLVFIEDADTVQQEEAYELRITYIPE